MRESVAGPPAEFRMEPGEKILALARTWLDGARKALGAEFLSAYLTGSCLTQDFDPRRSDVNLLIVVRALNRETLEKLARALPRRLRHPRVSPILYTQSQIRRSLDVFPIELLDFQERHVLLEGHDVLGQLKVDYESLRLECEHELRRRVLDLRHLYLLERGSTRILRTTMVQAARRLTGLFRTLLRLRGEIVPARTGLVIERVADAYGVSAEGLLAPYVLRLSIRDRTDAEIRRRYLDFLFELERLIGVLDGLIVP